VVQVSDRKLTYPSGGTYTDDANKAVIVYCDDGHFSVAYTGLARVRDKDKKVLVKTDHWIADSMWSIMQRPGRWGSRELYNAFQAHATETFEGTRNVPLTRKATTFVFAGFYFWATPEENVVGSPIAGSLSNMTVTPGGGLKVERDFATLRTWAPNRTMRTNEITIWTDGMVPALASRDAIAKAFNRRTRVLHRRLQRIEQGVPQRTREEVAKALVSIIRMASRHPQYGKFIGRDCTVAALQWGEDGFLADSYKENSIEHNFPWMVTRAMVTTASFSITREDGSDGFTARR
jgi:hypothetical protein